MVGKARFRIAQGTGDERSVGITVHEGNAHFFPSKEAQLYYERI